METNNAAAKIVKARAALVLDQRFFGSLALRLTPKEDPTCKTGWTDGKTLGYNPAFIDKLSIAETKGFLAHEVMHVATAHHARRQSRDGGKWNIACDYAINDVLLEAGFTLPQGALTGLGKDQSAETIYNKLPDDNNGGGGADPGACGEVRDATGQDGQPATSAELAQAEAEIKAAVAQAATAAKAAGQLPAGLERLIEEILDPKVPWREVLRRFVDEVARNDYTWTRPNVRYLAGGLYLPSLFNKEMPPIAVVDDTSGSIDQRILDQFGAELSAIIEDTKTTATVIYCDSQVNAVEEFSPECLPVKLHPYGGGGTDFRPPFAEVEKRGLQPACLIYFTDGECNRFPEAPDYPVLWATIGSYRFQPPFGEVVKVW